MGEFILKYEFNSEIFLRQINTKSIDIIDVEIKIIKQFIGK